MYSFMSPSSNYSLQNDFISGGGSSIRVRGTQVVWGTKCAEAESFSKNMCKISSNLAKIFKNNLVVLKSGVGKCPLCPHRYRYRC